MTIVEYGVNVTNGQCHPWNPFDKNFDTQSEAETAGKEYLRENPGEKEAIIFRLEIDGDEITSDETLFRINRKEVDEFFRLPS